MIRNVLICTTQVPFTTGGAEAHVAGLRSALIESGYNCEVVTLPFRWYPPVEIMRHTLMWRLLNLVESNGRAIDLVIGMKFPAYTVSHPRKVLWVIHQHRSAYNLWGTRFDDLSTYPEGAQVRDFIQRCDQKSLTAARKVFANSDTVAGRLRRYNKVESETLYHPPPCAESLLSGEPGDYVFCPGRLEPQKRPELLIEAMHQARSPVRLILAGGSSNVERYKALIAQYRLQDRIELAGHVSEDRLIELYSRALAVAYVPFDEDYGYVTLEAMFSSRPVVVTADSGGPTEFVEDQATGFVVEPEPAAIASAFDQLHDDREQARAMGRRGLEKVRALNLSWQNVVDKLISAAE